MNTLRSLVYDAPTRWFHWLFAALFVTAFAIANLAEDSRAFPLHMLAGLMLATLVVLRLIWGLIGTRHARLSGFALDPRALFSYFRGMFTGGGEKWTGHNPASSWAALIMIALASGLAITGVLMTGSGGREAYEDLHEVLANSFLVVALMHVAGVILHSLRHRDGFARSMVDGRKQDVPEGAGIASTRPVAALLMLGLMATAGYVLWKGYEPGAGTLTAFGVTLQLGENEADEDRHAYVGGGENHESAGEDD
jgi:cytochrome b